MAKDAVGKAANCAGGYMHQIKFIYCRAQRQNGENNMCGNCFNGNSCIWIILILIILFFGCGNGCGCENGCGNGCNNGCGC
jgi:hypothetical protein